MLRLAVVCAMLSGCNVVFGVDRDVGPAVCGPYAVVDEVAFDPSLTDVRELSIDATGARAMVWAEYKQVPGPVALTLAGGVWIPDAPRSSGLEDRDGARLVWRDDDLFSWKGPDLDEYVFAGDRWSYWAGLIDAGTTDDKRPGNAIEVPINASSVLRLLVETRIPLVGRSRIVIRSFAPFDTAWQPTDRLRALVEATPPIAASLGLLTANGDRLLYAATVGDEHSSHLYASHVNGDGGSFDPGERVQIDGIDDGAALTEPWINQDCSELWFNADGTILHARQLAAPDGAQ
jgi:hypothetical protein